jgi:hexosaminidase
MSTNIQSLLSATLLSCLFLVTSCSEPEPKLESRVELTSAPFIPMPVTLSSTGGAFFLDVPMSVTVVSEEAEVERIANELISVIGEHSPEELSIQKSEDMEGAGIFLTLSDAEALGEEGYLLKITKDQVILSANRPAGLYYGVQTIRQMIQKDENYTYLPTGEIWDKPAYEYRGSMVDVARHFFTVDEVKKYMDYMSFYKMNYLHLHLSDDQGWRIEIKSWPNLTVHGGSTEVGGGEGGFFTQEEYSDLVKYGQDRFITIVPEIDLPGHTNAALASYPELNCDGKARDLYTGTEVGFSTLCVDSEVTYKFIDDVVREISALTPGPYFHLGGDESHVTPLEDYIPFINRVQDIIASHNKTTIGWDEMAHATIQEGNIAQFWSEEENALKAVEQGAKILMSPAWKAYLDMQYDSTSKFGLHWAAYIPVDSAYQWSPDALVKGIGRENILGIEAPLWSETVSNLDEAEYLVFPRLLGYAEIAWSPTEKRVWSDFRERLAAHGPVMEEMGIDFYKSPVVDWK